MAINFGALLRLAPAAASGLAAVRKGSMAGQREREQLERQNALDLFGQWAQRQQLDISRENLDNRRQTEMDRLENARRLREMQEEGALERRKLQDENALLRTQEQVGGRERVAGMQYGEGGAVDRTNSARSGDNSADNATALEIARLRADVARDVASQRGAQGARSRGQRPTGEQEKSYLYYGLMQEGNKTMGMFSDKIRPEVIGAYVNSRWLKPALTPEEQQFMQGARNFAAGVLRKETGAAIKDDELRDVMARFIDMPLDAPATREQKRKSRAEYERRMGLLARPVTEYYEEDDTTPPPTAPQGASRARQALQRLRGQ